MCTFSHVCRFQIPETTTWQNTSILQGYYSLYQTQGCAYTLKFYGINVFDEYDIYPPSVEIYPVVDLPRYAYEINHDWEQS
jgi:hypothetical protein